MTQPTSPNDHMNDLLGAMRQSLEAASTDQAALLRGLRRHDNPAGPHWFEQLQHRQLYTTMRHPNGSAAILLWRKKPDGRRQAYAIVARRKDAGSGQRFDVMPGGVTEGHGIQAYYDLQREGFTAGGFDDDADAWFKATAAAGLVPADLTDARIEVELLAADQDSAGTTQKAAPTVAQEVLRITRNGGALTGADFQFVSDLTEGRALPDSQARLAAIHGALVKRTYQSSRWFHGEVGLFKDSQGYVYWRGRQVEHFSFGEDKDREREAALRLSQTCQALEAAGIEVRGGTVTQRDLLLGLHRSANPAGALWADALSRRQLYATMKHPNGSTALLLWRKNRDNERLVYALVSRRQDPGSCQRFDVVPGEVMPGHSIQSYYDLQREGFESGGFTEDAQAWLDATAAAGFVPADLTDARVDIELMLADSAANTPAERAEVFERQRY
jgi:hypothetical protein